MQIPLAYQLGYEKARLSDPDLASRYIEHTLIGDPEADALIDELADLVPEQMSEVIRAGLNRDGKAQRAVPQAAQDFFERIESPPPWFDPKSVYPGCNGFHANSDLFLTAFVTDIIIRGFTTLISQSFSITGRLTFQGTRRLRQNIRHLLEIMLPDGLERDGDGWKLSVRLRLVHARIRRHLAGSHEWDMDDLGVPISAAHIALASCNFSANLLRSAEKIGARLNEEQRAGFMHIWRYTAWLMGVPDPLLFRDEDEARELFRVGYICEPPPTFASITMANSLIVSAPLVIGIEERDERDRLIQFGYRLSRALIGDELADELRFPNIRTTGMLVSLRLKRRIENVLEELGLGKLRRKNFETLLDIAMLDEDKISYRMPDRLYSDEASPW